MKRKRSIKAVGMRNGKCLWAADAYTFWIEGAVRSGEVSARIPFNGEGYPSTNRTEEKPPTTMEAIMGVINEAFAVRPELLQSPSSSAAEINFRRDMQPRLFGMRVMTNIHLTKMEKDWSGCRSPARAQRRARRGFPQRVVVRTIPDPTFYQIDNTLICHPETLEAAQRRLEIEARSYLPSPTLSDAVAYSMGYGGAIKNPRGLA